jgi:membrane protease YdiL (CAAX protease family)
MAEPLASLRWLIAESPSYPRRPIDERTVDLLGLRVPALATVALLLTSFLLLLDRNYDVLPRFGPIHPESLRNQAIERFVLFLVVPVAVLLVLREDPRAYGLRPGDRRRGILLLAGLSVVSVPLIVLVAAVPDIGAWYAPSMTSVLGVTITNVIDLVATEFVLRGFLLFALLRLIGPLAVVVAVVPFAFSHIGKPDLEVLSTLVGGLVFGWIVWRTGSIVWSAAYHVVVQTTVIVAAAAWAGGGLGPIA